MRSRVERKSSFDECRLPGPGSDRNVTIVPGDILIGESHGVLVIPAAIVNNVLTKAMAHDDQERFQRSLLLSGESIYGVYPTLNEKNKKRFEEAKQRTTEKNRASGTR